MPRDNVINDGNGFTGKPVTTPNNAVHQYSIPEYARERGVRDNTNLITALSLGDEDIVPQHEQLLRDMQHISDTKYGGSIKIELFPVGGDGFPFSVFAFVLLGEANTGKYQCQAIVANDMDNILVKPEVVLRNDGKHLMSNVTVDGIYRTEDNTLPSTEAEAREKINRQYGKVEWVPGAWIVKTTNNKIADDTAKRLFDLARGALTEATLPLGLGTSEYRVEYSNDPKIFERPLNSDGDHRVRGGKYFITMSVPTETTLRGVRNADGTQGRTYEAKLMFPIKVDLIPAMTVGGRVLRSLIPRITVLDVVTKGLAKHSLTALYGVAVVQSIWSGGGLKNFVIDDIASKHLNGVMDIRKLFEMNGVNAGEIDSENIHSILHEAIAAPEMDMVIRYTPEYSAFHKTMSNLEKGMDVTNTPLHDLVTRFTGSTELVGIPVVSEPYTIPSVMVGVNVNKESVEYPLHSFTFQEMVAGVQRFIGRDLMDHYLSIVAGKNVETAYYMYLEISDAIAGSGYGVDENVTIYPFSPQFVDGLIGLMSKYVKLDDPAKTRDNYGSHVMALDSSRSREGSGSLQVAGRFTGGSRKFGYNF